MDRGGTGPEFMTPIRLAILLSGSGTTLQNLFDRIADGRLDAKIVQVVSSKATAFGVERARRANLPVAVVERKQFDSVESFSSAIFGHCRDADLVCLAGFLQLLKHPANFRGRVLNIHPALLPAFGGKGMYGHHVHEAVIRAGIAESGCTVHLADDQYDHGEIVVQKRVPVLPGDTAEALAARVFAAECEAYPEAIRRWADQHPSELGLR
jgi:formyltetrahydrofolate-dependent phosphoribosylglycinamide formyltransferase